MGRTIPPSALHEQSRDVATILRALLDLICHQLIHDLKLKADNVDGVRMLTRKVLDGARQEGLWEEEAADPVYSWRSMRCPVADEGDALQQVVDP